MERIEYESLHDRRVLIIGGSSGMGFATAERAIALGASVAIAARGLDRLADAASRLSRDKPVPHTSLHIEDRLAVADFLQANAPFDHLVLPGSTVVPSLYGDLTPVSARAAFDSKFWGPFWAVFDARPHMRPGGSVVLYSGIAAHRPVKGYVVGAAINGAINALTRSLALELGPLGLRINTIAPGAIDTPLWDSLHGDRSQRRALNAARLPLGRVGTPADAASAAIFLMANAFMTGQVVWLDGGAEALE
jgi:NAD(P)-dependent dehydrogenase (short-subunit alcohol dehydrogenase family)